MLKPAIVWGVFFTLFMASCATPIKIPSEGLTDPHESSFLRTYELKDGFISRDTLKSYLSRAITQSEFVTGEDFFVDGPVPNREDDVRMVKNLGAKFIGRAIFQWNNPERFANPDFLSTARDRIAAIHDFDPEIVIQAAIFEIVSEKVEDLSVPDWVFEEFGEVPEDRNFSYEQMLNLKGRYKDHWGKGASVPDISRRETQRFFYFMARQYMDIGVEAIHFGQASLMAMEDRKQKFSSWDEFISRIRKTAVTHGRRGTVILDSHIPKEDGYGIVIDGRLLFDFISFPVRPNEILGSEGEVEMRIGSQNVIYGRTPGGVTPSGWKTERSYYLVELDNFGMSSHPGEARLFDKWTWGWDEISWFASQSENYRNSFLRSIVSWLDETDDYGFFQMPGNRVIAGESGGHRYRINKRGQEETVKEIWSAGS